MITITDSAKQYLTSMTESAGNKYARLEVAGGGCSGFQYKWDLVDQVVEGELFEDILVVDTLALMYVAGCTVDYIQEFGGSYLTVVNPNAVSSCGCGESFAV